MLINMRNFVQTTWRKVHASGVSTRRGANLEEQTRQTWAALIESYEAVPKVYQDFFAPFLAEGRAFPYTVLAPSHAGFIHRTTEKLVCEFDCEIYILERSGNTYGAQCYPLEGISYVEVRTILLDSSIKISGLTKQGVPASSTFKFNSITDHLFKPILKGIRQATFGQRGPVQSSELEKFDQWVSLNYKFMNFAKRSLLGGEKVIHAILQPEIRVNVLTVLGMTYQRMVSPAHVCILTDRELITIREEQGWSRKDKYGGTWDYIPLNKITDLSVSMKDRDLLVLSIQLPEGEHLERIFQASAKQDVDPLLERFRELTRDSA